MTFRSTVVLAMVALAACDNPVAAPSSRPQGPLFDNTTIRLNETSDISGTIVSPCTGEPIAYQGSQHIVSAFTPTAQGFSVDTHFNTQSLSGVGLVTGAKYQISDAFNEQEDVVTLPLGGTADVAEHLRVISQGSLDNFLVDLVYTFTFPPPAFSYDTKNRRCEG